MSHFAPKSSGSQQILNSSHELLLSSVTQSSRYTYRVGWKNWVHYASFIGSDPYLSTIPIGYEDSFSPLLRLSSFAITAAVGFLSYLTDPDFGICIQPKSAMIYWSAARYHLHVSRRIDITMFDDSPSLKAARKGLVNQWQSFDGNSIAERRTLPFTLDAILRAQTFPYPKASPSFSLALKAAMFVGYTFLCRVGEYLYTGPLSSHHLLSRNAWFLVRSKNDKDDRIVRSHDIHVIDPSDITAFVINICSAKNDQRGEGHRYILRANKAYPISITIISTLARHASLARPSFNSPFFSSSVEGWNLSFAILNKYMKQLATKFNLDPSRVSTHSLRVAGASALYNAGVQDSIIIKMGRWKSLAFLEYLRDATPSHDIAFAALLCPKALSIDKLHQEVNHG